MRIKKLQLILFITLSFAFVACNDDGDATAIKMPKYPEFEKPEIPNFEFSELWDGAKDEFNSAVFDTSKGCSVEQFALSVKSGDKEAIIILINGDQVSFTEDNVQQSLFSEILLVDHADSSKIMASTYELVNFTAPTTAISDMGWLNVNPIRNLAPDNHFVFKPSALGEQKNPAPFNQEQEMTKILVDPDDIRFRDFCLAVDKLKVFYPILSRPSGVFSDQTSNTILSTTGAVFLDVFSTLDVELDITLTDDGRYTVYVYDDKDLYSDYIFEPMEGQYLIHDNLILLQGFGSIKITDEGKLRILPAYPFRPVGNSPFREAIWESGSGGELHVMKSDVWIKLKRERVMESRGNQSAL